MLLDSPEHGDNATGTFFKAESLSACGIGYGNARKVFKNTQTESLEGVFFSISSALLPWESNCTLPRLVNGYK